MNVVLIHVADVEIFYWISEHFDLLVALNEKSGIHQSLFHGFIL